MCVCVYKRGARGSERLKREREREVKEGEREDACEIS